MASERNRLLIDRNSALKAMMETINTHTGNEDIDWLNAILNEYPLVWDAVFEGANMDPADPNLTAEAESAHAAIIARLDAR